MQTVLFSPTRPETSSAHRPRTRPAGVAEHAAAPSPPPEPPGTSRAALELDALRAWRVALPAAALSLAETTALTPRQGSRPTLREAVRRPRPAAPRTTETSEPRSATRSDPTCHAIADNAPGFAPVPPREPTRPRSPLRTPTTSRHGEVWPGAACSWHRTAALERVPVTGWAAYRFSRLTSLSPATDWARGRPPPAQKNEGRARSALPGSQPQKPAGHAKIPAKCLRRVGRGIVRWCGPGVVSPAVEATHTWSSASFVKVPDAPTGPLARPLSSQQVPSRRSHRSGLPPHPPWCPRPCRRHRTPGSAVRRRCMQPPGR